MELRKLFFLFSFLILMIGCKRSFSERIEGNWTYEMLSEDEVGLGASVVDRVEKKVGKMYYHFYLDGRFTISHELEMIGTILEGNWEYDPDSMELRIEKEGKELLNYKVIKIKNKQLQLNQFNKKEILELYKSEESVSSEG